MVQAVNPFGVALIHRPFPRVRPAVIDSKVRWTFFGTSKYELASFLFIEKNNQAL
jgi:hypothetical protein